MKPEEIEDRLRRALVPILVRDELVDYSIARNAKEVLVELLHDLERARLLGGI